MFRDDDDFWAKQNKPPKEYVEGDSPDLCVRCWSRNSIRIINNKPEWYCFKCASNMYEAFPPKRGI
jgi:hypothetical protein